MSAEFHRDRKEERTLKQTTIDEVRRLAQEHEEARLIPICRELLSDIRTPLEVLRAFMNVDEHCFILESAEDKRSMGRYTFLGYDPRMELVCKDHELMVSAGGTIRMHTDHPGTYLRQVIQDNRSVRVPGMPPFTGGLVGYFSYDYMKYGEPSLKLVEGGEDSFRDMDLMLFDKLVCFDHYDKKLYLIANVRTDSVEENYNKAVLSLNTMEKIIRTGSQKTPPRGHLAGPLTLAFSEEEYCRKVEQVKEHIFEGDIFQLVLSNPMRAPYEGSLFNTYRILRTTNPSPYMFYFSGKDVEIAGASPETLVKIEDGTIRTFPLAGTRPRGRTDAEDKALEEGLLADEKECAEHNMLVDLGRNDLGRVCSFGSVKVEKYMEIERYSHVMHIGSCVVGQIADEKFDAVDAVDAVLPAGTLSGAPKIRACQLINELEGDKRGLYGGAVGYLDFTGNLDVCIAIRLAYRHNGQVTVRTGAGIVADSVPENEFQECRNKAAAVVQALQLAEEVEDA